MTKNKPIKKSSPKKKAEPSVVIDNTKLQLILAWEEVKQEYDKVLKKSAKNIKAQGFRQGKIPLKIAEEKLGRNRIINQVLETLVPQKYQDLIKKEKKEPLTSPEVKPISINWGQDWELEIQIAEKPIIKLDNYQKSIKKGLNIALKQLKEQKSQPTKDAKNKKEKPTKEQTADQEREIKLQQIFKALVEDTRPQIPELLLKEETKREIQRLAKELEKIGLSLDNYLAKRGQKFEEMSSQVAAQSLGQLQLEFVLEAIEQEQKIQVSKKDIEDELDKIKDEKVKKQIQNNHQYQHYLEAQISRLKLLDFLLEVK